MKDEAPQEMKKEVDKSMETVNQNGLLCRYNLPNLTKAEREVLDMITVHFYDLKQIVTVRKCSRQAVYKIVKKLKEKGLINIGLEMVDKSQWGSQPCQPNNRIRLHGQEFHIKILWQDNRYQELLAKSNVMFLDGHTVRLYKNAIEVYSGEGISFFADSPERAEKKSLEYWQRFFVKLEHKLSTIIMKEATRNIKLVNQHFARGNSEICDKSMGEREKIKIYALEDGKLAFITDDSFGLREDETVHPMTSKPDRNAIDKHINDWRLNNPPTNSELSSNVNNMVLGFDNYGKHISSHIEALQELGKGVKKLTRVMKGVLKENQILKLKSKHQRQLMEY